MKITIDENLCIGCGTCESLCQECFQMNGNIAKVTKENCSKCDAKEIASSCPTGAITVEQ